MFPIANTFQDNSSHIQIYQQLQYMKQKAGQATILQNTGLTTLQTAVSKIFNTAQYSKYCTCNICLQKNEMKERGQQFLKHSSSMFKIEVSKVKKFYSFLASVDHKIYFRLHIADICFFEGGEGKLLVKTKGNSVIAVQISSQMKKQIPNIFVDSKKLISQNNVHNEHNHHIKYFETVVPSFKHGLSNDNLDNKPKNYTFHSDQRENEEQLTVKQHHNPESQVAIIKYKDKGLELVNQKQLRQVLKSLAKSTNIELIQGYVRPHQRESQFIISEYLDYRKPQNVLMFNRSLIQMKTQIGLISKYSKQYIPIEYLQQYQNMLKQMPQQYCLYQTYKMVHYIEINRDVKVKCLNTVWFKDEFSELNFFGIMQFQFDQNEKVAAQMNINIEMKDVTQSEPTELQKQLLGVWQNMKKRKMKQYRENIYNPQNVCKVQTQMKKSNTLKNQVIYPTRKPSAVL